MFYLFYILELSSVVRERHKEIDKLEKTLERQQEG